MSSPLSSPLWPACITIFHIEIQIYNVNFLWSWNCITFLLFEFPLMQFANWTSQVSWRQYSLQLKIIQKVFTSLPKIKTVKNDKCYIFTKFRLLRFHIAFVKSADKLSFAHDPITVSSFKTVILYDGGEQRNGSNVDFSLHPSLFCKGLCSF